MRAAERIQPLIDIFLGDDAVRERWVEATYMWDYYAVAAVPCGVVGDSLIDLGLIRGYKPLPQPMHGFLELNKELNIQQKSRDILFFISNPLFISYWKENPDQRLGQAMINLGFGEHGMLWFEEETEFITNHFPELAPQILFWGSYGRDGKQPLRHIAIQDMETTHIQACLDTQEGMRKDYRKVMQYEINRRKTR